MLTPLLDDDAGFGHRVEYLTVEQLFAHASVEALNVAVLPWRARFDVGGPHRTLTFVLLRTDD